MRSYFRAPQVPGIYAIVNEATGMVYVGSTTSLYRRFYEHQRQLRGCRHCNSRLQRSWDKLGERAFRFVVLELIASPTQLVGRETHWFDVLRLETALYNFQDPVTNPMLGRTHSPETREKCRAAQANRPSDSAETRKLKSLAHLGIALTEEHRRKIARARAGPYPAFKNLRTGEVIPAGVNLKELCRQRGFDPSSMYKVVRGVRPSYRGWVLA
jgi:group I intron endonuclease